mmetsp:Transcript_49487/g.105333  ORF Transcript_49487/g.105333 Transcript_49487/m.105333 type:complete len:111 (+) Transcript_49487:727-1059(+)
MTPTPTLSGVGSLKVTPEGKLPFGSGLALELEGVAFQSGSWMRVGHPAAGGGTTISNAANALVAVTEAPVPPEHPPEAATAMAGTGDLQLVLLTWWPMELGHKKQGWVCP